MGKVEYNSKSLLVSALKESYITWLTSESHKYVHAIYRKTLRSELFTKKGTT